MEKSPQRSEPTFIQKFLSHYSYTQKFQTIAFLVGFITVLILYILISNELEDLSFADSEIAGNKYQSKVHMLMQNITKHSIYSSRYLMGDESTRGEITQLQNNINADFNQLLLLNKGLEEILETRPSTLKNHQESNIAPAEINLQWKELVNALNRNDNSSNNANHILLIKNLQELLRYIGDTSNMSYDSEIETHYLMETALYTLPEEQKLIATILIDSEYILDQGEITQKEQFELSKFISLLLSSVAITEQSIRKSIIEESNIEKGVEFKGRLNDSLTAYTQSIIDFTNFTNQFILSIPLSTKGKNPQENSDNKSLKFETDQKNLSDLKYYGESALAKNNFLWNSLTQQIEELLISRIAHIRLKGFFIIGLVTLVLSIAILLGYFVISETNKYFNLTYKAVNAFAQGDLSARVPVVYDTAFNKMRLVLNDLGDSIENLVEQLHKSGVQLTSTTTQIAAAAKHQEGTVCQQEATVKQILVTAGEILATARDFAKTMNEVSVSAEETSNLASSGKKGLSQMEESMHQMVKASKNIASKLAVLNEKAGTITSVITTITKVADQTNLLSLNAAIEAEKAGEHGKSFAVIAREIRRLADQTANATLDIEKMITEMMSAVSEGVMGVDKFSIEIRTGAEQVSTVSEQLTQIIERVQQQTVSYENVNRGVQAQSLGAEQINESIMQLSDAAQETTNSIRQFHAAIEQLNLSTKEMQSCVARLKK